MGEAVRLTPEMRSRKAIALDFVKRYFAQWGYPPSISELAAHLDVSRQRAHELLEQLSLEEQIIRTAGKARGIRLPDSGEEVSIGEMLVRLKREGWIVDAGLRTLLTPLTESGLSGLPELDHDPTSDIGVGNLDGDEAD